MCPREPTGPRDRAVAKPVCWHSVRWDLIPAWSARTCLVTFGARLNPDPDPDADTDTDPYPGPNLYPNLHPNPYLNQAPTSTPS